MTLSRRAAFALTLAALASCKPTLLTQPKGRPLDTKRLDREFPALAERARPGVFALGVMSLENTETWYWNIGRAFPLASLTEAPMAAAALAEVDGARLAMGERIAIAPSDLSPPYSVIDQRWPNPPEGYAAQVPAQTLLTLALQFGDNTAADVLMKRIGGPSSVTAWLQQEQITDMRVDRYQRELLVELSGMPTFKSDWKDPAAFVTAREQVPAAQRQAAMDAYLIDPRDTATLPTMLEFLYKLAMGQLLSPRSTALMLKWMESAPGGQSQLRAGLPANVRLAHKSGGTPTDLGFTAATNEVGVVTLPSGQRYAIAAFLAGSTAAAPARDALFADAARLFAAAAG